MRNQCSIMRILMIVLAAGAVKMLVPVPLEGQEPAGEGGAGKLLYELHCARCHGAQGLGDGPKARDLTVAPTNFQDPGFATKSDEQIVRSIEFGEVRSPMHAWRGRLTDQEIRTVAAYVRRLGRHRE